MSDNLTILAGDVRQTLASYPANSVHCCITSPPYWSLRSYLPANHALKAFELGSEKTPEEYIANMVAVFRQVRRVLRDDGTLWANIGETFTDGGRVGIPARFTLAMQADGWIWRDEIQWLKPSPMPMSFTGWQWQRCRVKTAKGRYVKYSTAHNPDVTQSHDFKDASQYAAWHDCPGCPKCKDAGGYVLRRGSWRTTPAHEPIFMFAKTAKYFCDGIGAREEAATSTIERNQYTRKLDDPDEAFAVKHDHEFEGLTRNPRSTWRIASGGSSLRHYATFPRELPERIIEIATPGHGVCAKCGAPWARMVDMTRTRESGSGKSGISPVGKNGSDMQGGGDTGDIRNGPCVAVETLGWRATCPCGTEDRTPATVLDCFGGSGTTAEAALLMGRKAVLCELNPEYVAIIRQRMQAACPMFCQEGDA